MDLWNCHLENYTIPILDLYLARHLVQVMPKQCIASKSPQAIQQQSQLDKLQKHPKPDFLQPSILLHMGNQLEPICPYWLLESQPLDLHILELLLRNNLLNLLDIHKFHQLKLCLDYPKRLQTLVRHKAHLMVLHHRKVPIHCRQQRVGQELHRLLFG